MTAFDEWFTQFFASKSAVTFTTGEVCRAAWDAATERAEKIAEVVSAAV